MSILDVVYVPFKNYIEGRVQLEGIMRYNSLTNIFLDWYDTKIFMGKIDPIEKLDQEVKQEYWDATKGLGDKETRIKAVKVLYVMTILAQNYDSSKANRKGAESI